LSDIDPSEIDPDDYRGVTRWILRRAQSGAAAPALFAAGVLDSSILPLPLEIALAGLMAGARRRIPLFLCAVVAGSLVGGLALYAAGALAMDTLGGLMGAGLAEQVEEAAARIREAGFAAVALGGLTPFPWPMVALGAGAADLPVWVFLAGALAGRGGRFVLIAVAMAVFGAPAMRWWRDAPGWARWGFWIVVSVIGMGWLALMVAG